MPAKRELEINCSSATLIGPTTLPLLETPVEGWVALAKVMGYRGLQWRPLRNYCLPEAQILKGVLTSFTKGGFRSAEQSYLGEKTLAEALSYQGQRRNLAVFSYMFFPYRTGSLSNLKRYEERLGINIFTVYQPISKDEETLQDNLVSKSIQPSLSLARHMGLNSLEELVNGLDIMGYGITLDLFHYSQLAWVFELPTRERALELMLPLIKEVHFSANRVDMDPNDEDTKQALKDLLEGTLKSEAAKMLMDLKEMGYQGPVVTEVASSSVGASPMKLFKAHRKFTSNLKRMLGVI